MPEKMRPLLEDFQQYFDLKLATTPEQRAKVYQIRYRVYCEEFGYEQAGSFPEQQESDDFDRHSSHCLVMHKSSGMPAGCARLVHVDEHSLMPMEKFCGHCIDQEVLRSFDGRRDTICEFSRLAVDGAFRRRPGEGATRFGEADSLDFTRREERTFSLIAISTVLSAFAMSELLGRVHCFSMVEPFLPRLMRRSGIVMHPIGTEIDYHGLRAPHLFDTCATVVGMPDELQEFYRSIRDSFDMHSDALEV